MLFDFFISLDVKIALQLIKNMNSSFLKIKESCTEIPNFIK